MPTDQDLPRKCNHFPTPSPEPNIHKLAYPMDDLRTPILFGPFILDFLLCCWAVSVHTSYLWFSLRSRHSIRNFIIRLVWASRFLIMSYALTTAAILAFLVSLPVVTEAACQIDLHGQQVCDGNNNNLIRLAIGLAVGGAVLFLIIAIGIYLYRRSRIQMGGHRFGFFAHHRPNMVAMPAAHVNPHSRQGAHMNAVYPAHAYPR